MYDFQLLYIFEMFYNKTLREHRVREYKRKSIIFKTSFTFHSMSNLKAWFFPFFQSSPQVLYKIHLILHILHIIRSG